jgi:hypothetical protein
LFTNHFVNFFRELRVKDNYWDKIQEFRSAYFSGNHVVGIQVRHGNSESEKSDFREIGREIKDFDNFIENLRNYLSKYSSNSSFFLAADSDLVVEKFREHFPKVITREQWRPEVNSGASHFMSHECPEGETENAANALIDMYLLGLCDTCIFTRGSYMLVVPCQMEKIYGRPSVKLLFDYKRHFNIGRFNPENFYSLGYYIIRLLTIQNFIRKFRKEILKRVYSNYKSIVKSIKRLDKNLKKIITRSIKNLKKKINNDKKFISKRLIQINKKYIRKLTKEISRIPQKTIKQYRRYKKRIIRRTKRTWAFEIVYWNIYYKTVWDLISIKNRIRDFIEFRIMRSGSRKLVFGKYDKLFLIKMNHSNAGFFAYFLYVLHQLKYCEKYNYLPVVYFGKDSVDGPNAYYDSRYGENMWDYYFEPVSDYTYNDIKKKLDDPDDPLTKDDITKLRINDLAYLHEFNPHGIYPFPYGFYRYKKNYDEKWYENQRDKARYFINKYIRIKKYILDEVNQFYNEKMKGYHLVGVHIRGTDKGSQGAPKNLLRIIEPDQYIKEIDKYSKKFQDCKIYVATDQQQYLDYVKEIYGDRIIFYPAIRSSSKVATFKLQDGNNYLKGKEILIESLLLSRCDFLMKCTSAVGEAAIWFNPDLKHIDMNYLY